MTKGSRRHFTAACAAILAALLLTWGEPSAMPAGWDFGSFLRSTGAFSDWPAGWVGGNNAGGAGSLSETDSLSAAGGADDGLAGRSTDGRDSEAGARGSSGADASDDRSSDGPAWRHDALEATVAGTRQSIHLLAVDPSRASLEPVLSHDQLFGYETLSEMDARHEAAASVNGWFSHGDGDAEGLILLEGQAVTPAAGLGPALILENGRASIEQIWSECVVERMPASRSDAGWSVAALPEGYIWQLNPWPMRPGFAVFTRDYGSTDRVSEAHVAGLTELDRLRGFLDSDGEAEIPPKGWTLAAKGDRACAALPGMLEPGDGVRVRLRLTREDGRVESYPVRTSTAAGAIGNAAASVEPSASSIRFAVEVGGWLVRDGANVAPDYDRWVGGLDVPTPRTAVGVLADGRVLFMIVDGRQGDFSLGVTGTQLADLLIAQGAVDAALLDGGGSSEMIVGGKIVNRPSTGIERPLPFSFVVGQ